jgi:hypothetical protein
MDEPTSGSLLPKLASGPLLSGHFEQEVEQTGAKRRGVQGPGGGADSCGAVGELGPGGPTGPIGPGGPISPFSPRSPGSPLAPCSPFPPLGPGSPSRQNLEDENNALFAKLRLMRGQH